MKELRIEIKNRFTGKVLFEYKSFNNNIKKTLIKALKKNTYLQGADLQGAYLRGADLQGAYLRGAYLQGAYLRGAYLQGADLRGADLRGAYLRGAYLQGADLQGADLRGADLRGADLQGADLRGADLRGADLQGADLRGADVKKIEHHYAIIPMDGAFIAWKKLRDNCIAKLEVPARSPRTYTLIGRKCRAKFVKTLAIYSPDGKKLKEMNGMHDPNTLYKVNRLTHSDKWDYNKTVECTHGIHFFISKQEAIEY